MLVAYECRLCGEQTTNQGAEITIPDPYIGEPTEVCEGCKYICDSSMSDEEYELTYGEVRGMMLRIGRANDLSDELTQV